MHRHCQVLILINERNNFLTVFYNENIAVNLMHPKRLLLVGAQSSRYEFHSCICNCIVNVNCAKNVEVTLFENSSLKLFPFKWFH